MGLCRCVSKFESCFFLYKFVSAREIILCSFPVSVVVLSVHNSLFEVGACVCEGRVAWVCLWGCFSFPLCLSACLPLNVSVSLSLSVLPCVWH